LWFASQFYLRRNEFPTLIPAWPERIA
jgi:hypothetical protein